MTQYIKSFIWGIKSHKDTIESFQSLTPEDIVKITNSPVINVTKKYCHLGAFFILSPGGSILSSKLTQLLCVIHKQRNLVNFVHSTVIKVLSYHADCKKSENTTMADGDMKGFPSHPSTLGSHRS